jgi:hypothetical protein
MNDEERLKNMQKILIEKNQKHDLDERELKFEKVK